MIISVDSAGLRPSADVVDALGFRHSGELIESTDEHVYTWPRDEPHSRIVKLPGRPPMGVTLPRSPNERVHKVELRARAAHLGIP